jgi:ABC-type glycerol-3-phosphate transport system substrate-binding protein
MVDNKWIAPNEVEQTQQDGQAGLQNDQTAMYMNGIWTLKNDLTAKGLSPDLPKHVKFSGLPALKGGGLVVENRVATVFGISANVKKDPAKLKAAIAFSKYFFSEPVAQKWVGLTWSAMGVSVPQSGTASLAPLPKAFLAASSKAQKKMVLPATPAMQDQLWADANTALQTLIQGKSAQEAQAAYVTFLAKYKKA